MKSGLIIASALALALMAAGGPASAKPVADEISSSENATIDTMADELFATLKAGQSLKAVNGFLGRAKLMASKSQEATFLASQIDSTINIYGPIKNCLLYSQNDRAGIVQARLYLCQHQDYLTRWHLSFGKTGNGWEPLSLNFDDKVFEDL